jgi:CO/xanthine dehydrogenase FAD-binding subunit
LKAAPFAYQRAHSLAEVSEVLGNEGDAARLIAGGQSLVPMMVMRITRPARLVDINEIAELKSIIHEEHAVRIGACARQRVAELDANLASRVPLIPLALAWVGHVQTRNRGTVGGSLANADPVSELPLIARVLGAQMVLRSARGTRTVDADHFFVGPLTTAIEPDECLEESRWPVWREQRVGSAFTEVSRRRGDFAIIEAAAQVALDPDERCLRATFGLGGGAMTVLAFPELAARFIGTRFEDAVVQSVAHDAAAMLDPGGDTHASAQYRRHLAEVLAARVLRSAYEDARARRRYTP